jgi:radical SAM-linked protein
MVGYKVRIRFRKSGDLRFLSHHDLMRSFERMLRRADLPFRSSTGFHPKPRIVFPLSMPLGVAGLDEVVEIELNRELPPEEVLSRLAAQAPAGLDFLTIRPIPLNLTGQVCRALYRFALNPERLTDLAGRCSALLRRAECSVQRMHPHPRSVDIRPYILGLEVVADALLIDLRVTPTGTARADEILTLLGLSDLLDAGGILERIQLQLHDELAPNEAPPPAAALLEVAAADGEAGEPPDGCSLAATKETS